MENLFSVAEFTSADFKANFSDEFYHIFLFEGNGKLFVDFAEYEFSGKTIFFSSPFQNLKIETEKPFNIHSLSFHGDFYCIEYHKNEVACNGLLFNNIYLFPQFELEKNVFAEILEIFGKIKSVNPQDKFSDAILKSYLQLILAICSQKKNQILAKHERKAEDFSELKTFQALVEDYFLIEKSPSFYAEKLHVTPNTLSKKIKKEFGKTPSQIIQERVILEAKKLIHLTRKSMKEISSELNFDDELYFSKYFKKHTGVSPTKFRDEVGISVVAE